MSIILFVLLSILVSVFVVMPLVQNRNRKQALNGVHANVHAGELAERKQNLYKAIKEIEFDFEMGKLSEADFQELRQQYKDEAVTVLKRLDQVTSKKVGSKEILTKGAQSKSGKGGAKAKFCWVCGTGLATKDNFCPSCGTNVREA